MYESEAEGRRNRGRPSMRWLNRKEKECNAKSQELKVAKVQCVAREQCEGIL